MHDAVVQAADGIELDVLSKLERLYPAAIYPLMKKYEPTVKRLEKLEKDGAYGRARVLIRQSGMVEDFAKALAAAGVKAADLIRDEMSSIREVAHEPEAAE